MRPTMSPTEFIKIATTTAEHFGFRSIDVLKKDPACKQCEQALEHTIDITDSHNDETNGILSHGLTTYCLEKMYGLNTPVLFYAITESTTGELGVALHIYHVPKSIAEALLIQTNRAIANELGGGEHTIRINSLGDNDSQVRYTREVTNFLRRRLDQIPTEARELMKKHPLLAMRYLTNTDHELSYKAPNPLEYLSDQSRKHFRDIIEFLDESEAPYEIDTKMLAHHEYYSDAIFDIIVNPDETGTAPFSIKGGRYDEFVFRKTKKRTPAVGSVVTLHNKPLPTRLPRTNQKISDIYIIQLGFGPKVRTLLLIEDMRKAGLLVNHDLANDSLSAQLRQAESLGMKYVLIMGQKEYVDGTIILRDMRARKQEAVPPEVAIKRLKRGFAIPSLTT